jgi:cystathionine beta-lyase/cystathionine gamma-synthase
MGATTALFVSLLKAGDHVVVSDVVYGGTVRLIRQVFEGLGISATFADTSRPEALAGAITRRTRLVFIETPANPTLKLTDIARAAAIARAAGVPLAVDNTVLTAVLQRPLELGAAASVYSTTKYIEGHNATVGGAVVTRDEALLDRLRLIRKTLGSIQAPFDAWLTLRGITTLPLRMRAHCAGARAVAEWLAAQPAVTAVHYPGLQGFPQAELAARQQDGAGGIIAFEVAGGLEAGKRLMASVRLCSLAENLGAAETLITHPVSMTHGDVPTEQRRAAGITDGLIRLSVGLEDPADIIVDLERALEAAVAAKDTTKERSGACRVSL